MRHYSSSNLIVFEGPQHCDDDLTIEIKERVAKHGTFLHEWDDYSESIGTSTSTTTSSYDLESSFDSHSLDNHSIDDDDDDVDNKTTSSEDDDEAMETTKPSPPVTYGAYSCYGEEDYEMEDGDDYDDACLIHATIQKERKLVQTNLTSTTTVTKHIISSNVAYHHGYSYFGTDDNDDIEEGEARVNVVVDTEEEGYSFFGVEDLPKLPQQQYYQVVKKATKYDYPGNMEETPEDELGYSFFGIESIDNCNSELRRQVPVQSPQPKAAAVIMKNHVDDNEINNNSNDDTANYIMYGSEILQSQEQKRTLLGPSEQKRVCYNTEYNDDNDGDEAVYTLYGE